MIGRTFKEWWARGGRHVLVHAHQFKNAGTTFDGSLLASFGEQFFDHRDDENMLKGADYFGPWLEQHSQVRAVSSHWITFPLPRLPRMTLHLVLWFRDPVERALSVYNFERAQLPAETPGSKKAKEVNFLEYVRWQLEPEQGPALRNFHTRYCSGDYLGTDLDSMYQAAKATIASTDYVGLVHAYEESAVLLEYQLSRIFPDLDLSYRVENSTGGHEGSLAERRAAVEDMLAPVLDQYLAANTHDLALFEYVQEKHESNFARLPDLEQRLAAMRERCSVTALG